jgi:hypothetical protein
METDKKNAAHAHGQGRLKWHPVFLKTMQLELADYRDFLEFMYEYQLTSVPGALLRLKPSRIYCRISPCCVPRGAKFIHSHRLTRCFSSAPLRIDETSPGIYRVSGDYVPIQIIETKKLPGNENIWLKSLANDLEFRGMGTIQEAGQKQKGREEIGAYFDLVIRANLNTFLEVQKMGYPTMEEVLTEAGYLPEWLERGRAQGMEAGIQVGIEQGMEARELEIAQKMKNAGRPFSEIAEFTGLTAETIERL